MVKLPALTPRGRIAGWCVAAGLVLGGVYQVVFVDFPASALRSAEDHYVQQLADDHAQANDLSVKNTSRTWFEESYIAAVTKHVTACEEGLKTQPATAEFKGVSISEARSRVAVLEAASAHAMQACDAAKQLMAEQDTARTRAETEQSEITLSLKEAAAYVATTTTEFKAKSNAWLPKYSTPLAEDLLQAAALVSSAQTAYSAVAQKLPAVDVVGRGDPDGALAAFGAISADVNAARSLGDKVAARMAFILKAEREAESTLTTVSQNFMLLGTSLSNVTFETGYTTAMRPFQSNLAKLDGERVAVEAALKANDKVLSYELGLALLDREAALGRNLDTFLRTFRANKDGIRQASVDENAAVTDVADASRMLRMLRSYHDASEWRNVAEVESAIGTLLASHRELLTSAAADNGVGVQNPVRAASELSQANGLISDIKSQYRKLKERYQTLEDFRSKWSSAEDAASLAIESERPQIKSYGSYDSDAESSFESAVTYYSRGVSAANSRLYGDAIDDFNRAAQTVRGVGDAAESSYDDEQRRKRRAAEDAADAAAAARKSVLSSSDTDSSSGWSTPSYSSDSTSSDSSSDWGGSFGGSSDSSDWGGSSTSSDGGDW